MVSQSGCRLLAQFSDVTSLSCFYLFSFNDRILKLSQIIFCKKLKLRVMNNFFY